MLVRLALLASSCLAALETAPMVGFGTYPLRGNECTQAVENAAKCGYRIIDTATFYQNFDAIATAFVNLDREEFYIISKVWPDRQTPAELASDLDSTLEQLQTDYIDAYLIHWPNSNIPIEETLQAMEELRVSGKIRDIGLSNVTVNHLKRILELEIPISWVQIEMSPLFYDPLLLEFCRDHGIAVQAWSPLGRGSCSKDPALAKIGQKYGKNSSQVALRWILQHGCIPLPGSSNERHIQENIDVFDFALTDEEMEQIDQVAIDGPRLRITPEFNLGFTDEFDFTYEECWPKR